MKLGQYKSRIGYTLSSEEEHPLKMLEFAKYAEDKGFEYIFISDHFHPWIDEQAQSPFVWSALGGLSVATKETVFATGVTCPILRIHPAIIAQAAATTASMLEGRFILGLGTGENLNEHIIGEGWPHIMLRREMLEEAVEIIRKLWTGDLITYFGNYFIVEQARVYTLPKNLPPIYIAASGPKSAALAGKIGDGLISTSPNKDVVKAFEDAGGGGKPKYAQFTVCYGSNEKDSIDLAYKIWPNALLHGQLSQEIKTPKYFKDAVTGIPKEMITESIICSTDPNKHIDKIQEYIDAGFDYVYVHQVGPNQKELIDFYTNNILDKFQI